MKHLILIFIFALIIPSQASAQEIIDITFPVQGENTYQDDFDQQRSGHMHHATDIMAAKMTPIVAAVGGTVTWAPNSEPYYGFMLTVKGDDGYTYNYVHLNNDTPGTDDGKGGAKYAYASGIKLGVHVKKGQLIGWVGDSGNAENIGSHLHFEIYDGNRAINPYYSLLAAEGVKIVEDAEIADDAEDPHIPEDADEAEENGAEEDPEAGEITEIVPTTADYHEFSYNPEKQLRLASSINQNQDIPRNKTKVLCRSNSLIRTEENATVYYCGQDGGRYIFQNESTFFSWYENFDDVEFISGEEMSGIPLKGVVTYRPGTFLVKIQSVPKVYAVGKDGTLHWIPSEEIAASLFGNDWASKVRDIPDSFFPAYTLGGEVNTL